MRRSRRTTESETPRELRPLEDALRRYAPQPSALLVRTIGGPVPEPARRQSHRPQSRRPQALFAAGLTAALLAALAAVGGVSYAATAVGHAVSSARIVFVTHVHQTPLGLTAGGDQYRPGYGFGDPNHNHTGPPGLTRTEDGSGTKAPPPQTTRTRDGKAILVQATIAADEQAALYFSVVDANGRQLLLTQRGSTIGHGVQGPQTKTIHYVMLVPRAIPLRLRIPANLLAHGATYRIRVIAVDAQGNKTTFFIPFTA
jgi:hypothetical protein